MGKKFLGFFGQKNKWTHDHSITTAVNDTIKTYLQLERLTRRKYDNDLPNQIKNILAALNIDSEDLNEFEIGYANTFSLDPDLFFKYSDNNIISSDNTICFVDDGINNLQPVKISGRFVNQKTDATVVPHELAHIFSVVPFYGLFEDRSLLIHIDGAASISNASAWYFHENHLELLEYTTLFHHALLNFSYNDLTFDILNIDRARHFSIPGKLMGFASYGKASNDLLSWLKGRDFFIDYTTHPKSQFIFEAQKKFGYKYNDVIQKDQLSYDIAACMQKHFEEKITTFIRKHQQKTGAKKLYYAGGAALNIKLNAHLVNSRIFDEILIPPPSGDSGLSLGVVAYLNWLKGSKYFKQVGPFLNNFNLKRKSFSPNYSLDQICKELAGGKVIGIYWGYGEAGPRALGHRSILATPCSKKMLDRVSIQIKKREWYRPLAPIVLKSEIDGLFDDYTINPLMNYMLYEFKVKKSVVRKIPAVVHCDGTSRAQVISDDDHDQSLIFEILVTILEDFEIPCLINTSFNVAGEPIVHTKTEALNSARKMGLDGLILENDYISLR